MKAMIPSPPKALISPCISTLIAQRTIHPMHLEPETRPYPPDSYSNNNNNNKLATAAMLLLCGWCPGRTATASFAFH